MHALVRARCQSLSPAAESFPESAKLKKARSIQTYRVHKRLQTCHKHRVPCQCNLVLFGTVCCFRNSPTRFFPCEIASYPQGCRPSRLLRSCCHALLSWSLAILRALSKFLSMAKTLMCNNSLLPGPPTCSRQLTQQSCPSDFARLIRCDCSSPTKLWVITNGHGRIINL